MGKIKSRRIFLNEEDPTSKSWISLQSTEKPQTWALCFLVPWTLRWNGDIKMIPTSSPWLWSTRDVMRGDWDSSLAYSYTIQLLQYLMRQEVSLFTPKHLEAFCGGMDDPYKDYLHHWRWTFLHPCPLIADLTIQLWVAALLPILLLSWEHPAPKGLSGQRWSHRASVCQCREINYNKKTGEKSQFCKICSHALSEGTGK